MAFTFSSDPIIQNVREGFVLDVRPTLAGGGELVILDIRASVARLVRPIGTQVTPAGMVEVPQVDMLSVRTTVATRVGRTAVVGGTADRTDGESFILLATPHVAGKGGK